MMLPSHVVFLDAITPQQQAESDARSYRALVGATPVEICLRHPFTKDHSGYNPSNQGREAAKTKKISMTMAEAQILFKCHHPSIHILLGTVILDMGPALVLERTACSLAAWLAEGPVTVRCAVRVASQV